MHRENMRRCPTEKLRGGECCICPTELSCPTESRERTVASRVESKTLLSTEELRVKRTVASRVQIKCCCPTEELRVRETVATRKETKRCCQRKSWVSERTVASRVESNVAVNGRVESERTVATRTPNQMLLSTEELR